MDGTMNDASDEFWRSRLRAVGLAEALFILRREPGFANLLQKIKRDAATASLRGINLEVQAARTFQKYGYTIHSREEVGVRGEDFDLKAEASRETINVEVTLLRSREASITSVRNSLKKKRDQVPPDKPAVIVLGLPGRWVENHLEAVVAEVDRFLARTQRINHVLLLWQNTIVLERMLLLALRWVSNPRARHPAPKLDAIIGGQRAVVPPLPSLGSDFTRWVDASLA
jgi:hypothetical protein